MRDRYPKAYRHHHRCHSVANAGLVVLVVSSATQWIVGQCVGGGGSWKVPGGHIWLLLLLLGRLPLLLLLLLPFIRLLLLLLLLSLLPLLRLRLLLPLLVLLRLLLRTDISTYVSTSTSIKKIGMTGPK